MNDENECHLPPPCIVAEMCEAKSWDDDVDDDIRLLLEQAQRTVRFLIMLNYKLAQTNERLECGR